MSAPDSGERRARYFDAEHPVGTPATVRVTAAGLAFTAGDAHQVWPLEEVTQPRRPRRGEPAHFERAGAALIVEDASILDEMAAAAPSSGARLQRARGASFAARVTIALAVIAALVFAAVRFGIPAIASSMARSVPPEWEEAFGAAVLESVAPESARMRDPRVVAPVEKIVARLASGTSGDPYQYKVFVVDRPEVNALAAPAGNIVVFRGMLDFTRTPEELAGVLAHEMEHVRRRHVTEGLFRSASLGVLFALAGGNGAGLEALGLRMAQDLSNLSYGRDAEREADAGGLERMIGARVDPGAMPELLARMPQAGKGTPLAEFLSTHPAPESRAERLRGMLAQRTYERGEPLLEVAVWDTLRAAVAKK